MKQNKAFKLALGGICLALTLIFMFAGSVVPGIELTLFAISSVFVAIMILETNVGGGILLYVAAALLGLILLPDKLALLPYVCLFGYYGIVKYFIEKLNSAVLQMSLKVIFFAFIMCIGLLGFGELLLGAVDLPDFPVFALIIGGVLLMMLYDYIYTLIIRIYISRIQRKGIDTFKLS